MVVSSNWRWHKWRPFFYIFWCAHVVQTDRRREALKLRSLPLHHPGITNIEPRYAKTMTLMSMCQCARWFNDMNLWQNYWGGGEKQEERLKNMGHALPLKAIDLPEPNMNVDVSNPRSRGLSLSSLSSSEWCSLVVIFHDAVGIRTNFWCRPALTSWGCLDTSSEDRSNPGKKLKTKFLSQDRKLPKQSSSMRQSSSCSQTFVESSNCLNNRHVWL